MYTVEAGHELNVVRQGTNHSLLTHINTNLDLKAPIIINVWNNNGREIIYRTIDKNTDAKIEVKYEIEVRTPLLVNKNQRLIVEHIKEEFLRNNHELDVIASADFIEELEEELYAQFKLAELRFVALHRQGLTNVVNFDLSLYDTSFTIN